MRVVRHTDIATFATAAVPFLLPAEAENNLLLGICAALQAGFSPPRRPYLATVEDGARVAAVALMIPPHQLVVTAAPPAALEALCVDLVDGNVSVPGVHGPVPGPETFARLWRRRTGDDVSREHAQRIYELAAVIPPRPAPGHLRQAQAADLPLVQGWAQRFVADTGQTSAAIGIAEDVRRSVAAGRLYVWEDGEPVTMAAWTGPTPNGVRLTRVYTPPARRGRGYASACVAALSAMLLASGLRFCYLFADLANPTSNSIYAKIGYRPVCDVDVYRFERRG